MHEMDGTALQTDVLEFEWVTGMDRVGRLACAFTREGALLQKAMLTAPSPRSGAIRSEPHACSMSKEQTVRRRGSDRLVIR